MIGLSVFLYRGFVAAGKLGAFLNIVLEQAVLIKNSFPLGIIHLTGPFGIVITVGHNEFCFLAFRLAGVYGINSRLA